MNVHVSRTLTPAGLEEAPVVHSPYLVAKLANQKPNLYGTVKFRIVAERIRRLGERLGRPPRVLDLGCSTSISREYLEQNDLEFEYCGVDYEAAFEPDIVMDVRRLYAERHRLPWQPDVIMLLDVLEHLPGKEADIEAVMRECDRLIPDHGEVLVIVPQLYRLDRLKLSHLDYPEHEVRFTLTEWRGIVERVTNVAEVQGVGYLSCLPYLPMLSPWYEEDNRHGRLFRKLRGEIFEWGPLKPAEIAITKLMGRLGICKGWCNSSLMVCKGGKSRKPDLRSV
jgi:hypothetical protein